MDSLSRREFFGLGLGAGSFAVVSGLGLLRPRRAYAVAGIDDVVLGGLVILVATLGGYAFSRSVANVSLDALGYGFSDFVSDAGNQAEAVTQAIADANNLGVELNMSNAENAAQSIAAGTGYFAQVMGDAATSGRVALDNFISGAGELPGVLRNLIGNFISSEVATTSLLDIDYSNSLADYTQFGTGFTIPFSVGVTTFGSLAAKFTELGGTLPTGYDNLYFWLNSNWQSSTLNTLVGSFCFFNDMISYQIPTAGNQVTVNTVNSGVLIYQIRVGSTNSEKTLVISSSSRANNFTIVHGSRINLISDGFVTGGTLPGVDRAADTPDVIGPGYDSLPLANDLVIDPSTDEVVSAGSLPLPTGIPDVFGDFVGTLNDILAGVIPGQISLPVSVAEPVVVGTAEGVQSMSISDAIAGETSLAAAVSPPVGPYPPYDPVEPPVDVPEGPWTPAVSLPFELIWPFNMIYSFVELFEQLGGS